MKILIDGDSCSAIKTVEDIAREYDVPCHIYCNTSAVVDSNYSQLHIVEKGPDSADFAIVNNCETNDIVITNDSGLAAMVLSKRGQPMTARGMLYTNNNIMAFLNTRYTNSNARRKSNRKQVHGSLYGSRYIARNSLQKMLKSILNEQKEVSYAI